MRRASGGLPYFASSSSSSSFCRFVRICASVGIQVAGSSPYISAGARPIPQDLKSVVNLDLLDLPSDKRPLDNRPPLFRRHTHAQHPPRAYEVLSANNVPAEDLRRELVVRGRGDDCAEAVPGADAAPEVEAMPRLGVFLASLWSG